MFHREDKIFTLFEMFSVTLKQQQKVLSLKPIVFKAFRFVDFILFVGGFQNTGTCLVFFQMVGSLLV